MCCTGKWEEQVPPTFDLEFPAGESLLKKQAILKVRLKDKARQPFSLFGHDWKLLVAGPKGESLPPVALSVSMNKESFVAPTAPLLESLQKLGATKVKARIVGRWGFTSIGTEPLEIPVGCDPSWSPLPEETKAFQIGKTFRLKLPGAWSDSVEKVVFLPATKGVPPLVAKLQQKEGGEKEAVFEPKPEDAGAGALEIFAFGTEKPALSRPLILQEATPEVTSLEARVGESEVILKGRHLAGIHALELGGRTFLPRSNDKEDDGTLAFRVEDGKPLEGAVGKKIVPSIILEKGKKASLEAVALLPARPRLGEVQVIPMEVKGTGLLVTSILPIAPTSAPSQVGLLASKGYRFPSDGGFHAAIRNSEEPAEIRPIPSSKFKLDSGTFLQQPSYPIG